MLDHIRAAPFGNRCQRYRFRTCAELRKALFGLSWESQRHFPLPSSQIGANCTTQTPYQIAPCVSIIIFSDRIAPLKTALLGGHVPPHMSPDFLISTKSGYDDLVMCITHVSMIAPIPFHCDASHKSQHRLKKIEKKNLVILDNLHHTRHSPRNRPYQKIRGEIWGHTGAQKCQKSWCDPPTRA